MDHRNASLYKPQFTYIPMTDWLPNTFLASLLHFTSPHFNNLRKPASCDLPLGTEWLRFCPAVTPLVAHFLHAGPPHFCWGLCCVTGEVDTVSLP